VNKWQRFRKLPTSQKNTLLWAFVLVPITRMALPLLGFQRWRSILAKAAPRRARLQPVTAESLVEARTAARMVAAASREGLIHGQCLEKSVVLWFLLSRRRVPAELRIGVRQATKGFEAHAWVEVQGTIVNDSDDVLQNYVSFKEDIASLGIER
jgi:hypothetical protein